MRVLYLYDRMKLNGPGYTGLSKFIDFLQSHSFLDLRYALVSDETYHDFNHSDPGFVELISASQFVEGGYDTIVQSGPLFQTNGFSRIDGNTIDAFWKNGGVSIFLWHVSDFSFGGHSDISHRLEMLRAFLGRGAHAYLAPYTPDGEGSYVYGLQGQSDRVKIVITGEYLANLPDVTEVYSGVHRLVVEKPIHLGPFPRWLCIGDANTWMVNSLDRPSSCSQPLVFGGVSYGDGFAAAITGHFANDYVLAADECDNIKFLWNLLNHGGAWRAQWPQHVGTNTVFISYSHADKSAVDAICRRLEAAGVRIWRDEKEIKVGQSITHGVEDGLRKADYFLLILSITSAKSAWVEMEYRTALGMALKRKKLGMILPVVLDGVPVEDLSLFLGDRKYADCSDMDVGIAKILEVVGS